MVANSTQWKSVIGDIEFAQRIQTALTTELNMQQTLKIIGNELFEIRIELGKH